IAHPPPRLPRPLAPWTRGSPRRPRTIAWRCGAASAGAFQVRDRTRLSLRPCFSSWAERSESEFAGDEHELDLGGALPDLEDLRVAVVAGDEEFVHEAVAAVDLGGIAGVVHRCLAGDHLRDRGLLLERQPGEHPGGCEVVRRAGSDDTRLHPGDLER